MHAIVQNFPPFQVIFAITNKSQGREARKMPFVIEAIPIGLTPHQDFHLGGNENAQATNQCKSGIMSQDHFH